jgi:hypothetical protein
MSAGICQQCRKSLRPGARYCTRCGSFSEACGTDQLLELAAALRTSSLNPSARQRGRNRSVVSVILGVVLVGIPAASLGWLFAAGLSWKWSEPVPPIARQEPPAPGTVSEVPSDSSLTTPQSQSNPQVVYVRVPTPVAAPPVSGLPADPFSRTRTGLGGRSTFNTPGLYGAPPPGYTRRWIGGQEYYVDRFGNALPAR